MHERVDSGRDAGGEPMFGVCFGDAEDALDGVGGFAVGLDGFEIRGFVVDETAGDAAVFGLGRVGLFLGGEGLGVGGEERGIGEEIDRLFDGDSARRWKGLAGSELNRRGWRSGCPDHSRGFSGKWGWRGHKWHRARIRRRSGRIGPPPCKGTAKGNA